MIDYLLIIVSTGSAIALAAAFVMLRKKAAVSYNAAIEQQSAANMTIHKMQEAVDLLTAETTHYKNLVESANELIFRCDVNGYFMYSNTMALKTWDLKEDEIIGKRYLDYVRDDYRRKTEKFFFRQFISKEQNTYYEYPVITPHGKEIWLGQNTQLLFEKDTVIGFQAVSREITVMIEMQKQLIESKEMYRSFISVLQEGVIVFDALGEIISANASAENIVGMKIRNLKDLTSADTDTGISDEFGNLLPPERHPSMITLTTGESQSDVILGIRRKDKSQIWISLNSQPLFQNNSVVPTGVVVSFIDITNRKEAQKELQHAKANIDAWLENTNDAVWSVDREFSLLMFNRYYSITCLLALGFRPTVKDSAFLGMSEEVKEYVKELYLRALGGEHFSVEQGIHLGGKYQYFEIALNPIYDGVTIVGVAALGKNITARKASEQQLRDTLHFQQAILNGADYMIIATTTEGVITIFNPAAERALGYSAAEIIGIHSPGMFHIAEEVVERAQELRTELQTEVEVGFETFVAKAKLGIPDENEWTYVHRSGKKFPVLLSVTATRNSEGEINGYLGIAKDISVQKESQLELERRDHLLEGISQSLQYLLTSDYLEVRIQEIITIIGSTSKADGVFLYRFNEYEAQPLESVLSYHWTKSEDWTRFPLIQPAVWEGAELHDALSHGKSINAFEEEFESLGLSEFLAVNVYSLMIVPIILRDTLWGAITLFDVQSKRIWAEWEKSILSGVAASIAGAIERWENQQKLHKFAEDIIEAKYFLEEQAVNLERQNEELLIAREAAEEANRAKSIFLSSMSHELRTPLNSILGFTQILLKDTTHSEQSRNYINMMYRSGSHLLDMINDVLDISKIESGYMELISEKFDIKSLLNDLSEMFALRCKEKGLSLTVEHSGFDGCVVWSDRKRLKQVLINFMSNAVKFTQKGSIHLKAEIVHEIPAEGEISHVRFTITDTGRGIPSEQLQSIFEPFKQVTGMYSEGTGLGLSISSRIVAMLGGEIKVTSVLDSGTTFWFDIPIAIVAQDGLSSSKVLSEYTGIEGGHAWNVLIVDDITTNRDVVRAFLEPLGFICTEAVDGKDCIRILQEAVPDIILMDILMPLMNGDEATKIIRMMDSVKEIPIIAVTASGYEGKKEELTALGFNDYLRKPFLEKELLDILGLHLPLEYTHDSDTSPQYQDEKKQPLSTREIVHLIHQLPTPWREELCTAVEFQDVDSIESLVRQPEFMACSPELTSIFTKAVLLSDYKLLVSIDSLMQSE